MFVYYNILWQSLYLSHNTSLYRFIFKFTGYD